MVNFTTRVCGIPVFANGALQPIHDSWTVVDCRTGFCSRKLIDEFGEQSPFFLCFVLCDLAPCRCSICVDQYDPDQCFYRPKHHAHQVHAKAADFDCGHEGAYAACERINSGNANRGGSD